MSYQDVIWYHRKSGHHYKIIDFGIREADLHPQVAYRRWHEGVLTPPTFYRDPEVFFDGRFTMADDLARRGRSSRSQNWDAPNAFDVNGEKIEVGDAVDLAAGYRETHRGIFVDGPQIVENIKGDVLFFKVGGLETAIIAKTTFKVQPNDRKADRETGDDMGEG